MNASPGKSIQSHYHRDHLYEMILEKLDAIGVNLKQVKRTDLSKVDEFHVRGAEVSNELAGSIKAGSKLLDVGCGIGGPCRLLADEYSCDVTGIDLSNEFIRTAKKLSELVGLNQITFKQADATSLPFEDASFDVVWTQHVQMNISDKMKFYSEISRVLRPEGKFIYYDIFQTGEGSIPYPMPWAETSDISHLFSLSEKSEIFNRVGLESEYHTDETQAGITFFENLLRKIDQGKGPTLGLNVLMGADTRIKLGNLLNVLRNGDLELESGVCVKK